VRFAASDPPPGSVSAMAGISSPAVTPRSHGAMTAGSPCRAMIAPLNDIVTINWPML
jgi:hypothetical protein